MSSSEASELKQLESLLKADPGLPRLNPTASYWLREPHQLAAVQSPQLPETTDVAIIGSGITGASVAKALLEQHQSYSVTVLEARTICSGATGRNGGQMAINAAETYLQLKEELGVNMSGKIIQFSIKTLDRLREIAKEFAFDDAECTNVVKLRSFKDEVAFEKVKMGIRALEEDHPFLKGIYSVVTAEQCHKNHGVFGVAGGILHPAGTIWPYKLVMKVFEHLSVRYASRLAIEANTPVTEVRHDPIMNADYPYVLYTTRGIVRSRHVAYCTNGYTGHLLPMLRGGLFPMKGTMTVQDLGNVVQNKGSRASWAIHYTPFTDESDGTLADGLIYGIQNYKSGAFYFGGEKSPVADLLSPDDSVVSPSSVEFLQKSLLSLFGHKPGDIQAAKLISSWSGVMCFSSDAMPLVGRLPQIITANAGVGEWICAAYNGYGMPTAWLAGESLGAMILGLPPQDCLPEAYLVTMARLRGSINVNKSIERLYKS